MGTISLLGPALILLLSCEGRPTKRPVMDRELASPIGQADVDSGGQADDTSKSLEDSMEAEASVKKGDGASPQTDQNSESMQTLPANSPLPSCTTQLPEQEFRGYVSITSGGKARRYYLSVPANYNPRVPMPVVFGFHGRDYDGVRMKDYLDLERGEGWAIFVYPDALQRNWNGVTAVGWQNGPLGATYGGSEDLAFIDDIIASLQSRFCTDTRNYFATGQSWGGDFSNVIGCFRGDIFRALVPVAANGAYYLPKDSKQTGCRGRPAAWPMHSKTDEFFSVKLGEEYRDFWLQKNSCSAKVTKLPINDDCFEYSACAQTTRWCLYTGNHQVPGAYYNTETVKFFKSFLGK